MCAKCPDPANARVNFHGYWPNSSPYFVDGKIVRGDTLAEYEAKRAANFNQEGN